MRTSLGGHCSAYHTSQGNNNLIQSEVLWLSTSSHDTVCSVLRVALQQAKEEEQASSLSGSADGQACHTWAPRVFSTPQSCTPVFSDMKDGNTRLLCRCKELMPVGNAPYTCFMS